MSPADRPEDSGLFPDWPATMGTPAERGGRSRRSSKSEEPLSTEGRPSEMPLADRLRPRTLDEFFGQEHIIGPGRLLRRAIQKDQLSSVIFAGPPGTGKTTLARIIASGTARSFITLNAVLAGIADIRAAIDSAKKELGRGGRGSILFVDEVHRWNKSQQDALLPWVENGTVILVGATTENPFFEVNKALLSRSRIFLLTSLTEADLAKVAELALSDVERGYGSWRIEAEESAIEHLVAMAEGDARNLLNALELAVETAVPEWPPPAGTRIPLSLVAAEESIQRRAILYDKDGDLHYDAASAFIKSIRGSDPDAALYWLARMVHAGENPRFMFRRMIISAAEDVGLADPQALPLVEACASSFDRIGMPEGQFLLSQAALYLATSPKSNSTLGYFDALKAVEEESASVPNHLCDANRDAKGFGHGEGYAYPHAYRDHWVAQQYLPDSLKERLFYHPGELGFEGSRRNQVLERREAQLAAFGAAEDSTDPEGAAPGTERAEAAVSAWSQRGEKLAQWRNRAESGASTRLKHLRSALFDRIGCTRADRILIYDARDGYLVWEARRRAPEGTVVALVRTEDEAAYIEDQSSGLGFLDKPLVVVGGAKAFPGLRAAQGARLEPATIAEASRYTRQVLEERAGIGSFDVVAARSLHALFGDPAGIATMLLDLCSTQNAAIWIAEASACAKARLSLALNQASQRTAPAIVDLARRFLDFEDAYYASPRTRASPLPDPAVLAAEYSRAGLVSCTESGSAWRRSFTRQEIESWFPLASSYGAELHKVFTEKEIATIGSVLADGGNTVDWPFNVIVTCIQRREPVVDLHSDRDLAQN